MLPLHPVGSNKTLLGTERKRALPLARVPVHVTPQLHLTQCIVRPPLENPHVHVLHVMLNHENIKVEIGLVKPRHPAAVPDDLGLRFLMQHGLEVKPEEEPSTPNAINALGALPSSFGKVEKSLSLIALSAKTNIQNITGIRIPWLWRRAALGRKGQIDIGGYDLCVHL